MYIINDTQYNIAKQLGIEIKPSTRKNKKIDVYLNNKYYRSIGSLGYNDYYSYLDIDKNLAYKKRKNYHKRMNKNNDYYDNGLPTPNLLSKLILW